MINYTVTETNSSGSALLATNKVYTATQAVPRDQIASLLGFAVDGDFVSNGKAATVPSTTDSKLWIIGAVLGPVAFVLLLIASGCFLYYKCRPRPYNNSSAQVISFYYRHFLFSILALLFSRLRLFTMPH